MYEFTWWIILIQVKANFTKEINGLVNYKAKGSLVLQKISK